MGCIFKSWTLLPSLTASSIKLKRYNEVQISRMWSETAEPRGHKWEQYNIRNDYCPLQLDWDKYIEMIKHRSIKWETHAFTAKKDLFFLGSCSVYKERKEDSFLNSFLHVFWYMSDTDVLTNKNQGRLQSFFTFEKTKYKFTVYDTLRRF